MHKGKQKLLSRGYWFTTCYFTQHINCKWLLLMEPFRMPLATSILNSWSCIHVLNLWVVCMWECLFRVEFRLEMLNDWLDICWSWITGKATTNCFIKYALIVSNNSSSTDVPQERSSQVASCDGTCSHPWIAPAEASNKNCLQNLPG